MLNFLQADRQSGGPAEAWDLLIMRVSMVPLFYFSGYGKLMHLTATADRLPGYAAGIGIAMAVGAMLLELLGGTALLTGIGTRIAAILFVPYIIAASLMFHQFWAAPPQMFMIQMINFLKNLGLLGAMVAIATFGPGAYSLKFGQGKVAHSA